VSVLATYPSYLGELVECGLEAGYGPADFGLLRILLGGEIATEGLKRRCRRLFGAVQLTETYGLTELVPFGATECADGHLHFQPTNGLLEIHDLESPGAAARRLLARSWPRRSRRCGRPRRSCATTPRMS